MLQKKFFSVDGGFLQSPQWEKFQNKIGRKTFRINKNGFSCLAIKYNLPVMGGYFFIPRGPIIQVESEKLKVKSWLNDVNVLAKEECAGWIRIEPQKEDDLEVIKKTLGKKYKIIKSKKDHEPTQTLMIDLRQSEENILAFMKSKTRYNIRLSEKKGVSFYISKKEEDVESFLALIKETARRDKIASHPDWYYRKMLDNIPDKNIKLILAKAKGKIIAGAIVAFYNSIATYLHGASANENRNLMASFGVQWTAIKLAKQEGCEKYDLGGVSMKTEKYPKIKKNWKGITRFKSGFCPDTTPVEFPGCWDIILDNKKYRFYRFLQSIKSIF